MNKTKKLYDLLYTPIVTPYNLLMNAKLKNYEYVNYYKGSCGLIAEMKCRMEDGQDEIFLYHFDKEDYLQNIFKKDKNENILIYSRHDETINERNRLIVERKNCTKKEVI